MPYSNPQTNENLLLGQATAAGAMVVGQIQTLSPALLHEIAVILASAAMLVNAFAALRSHIQKRRSDASDEKGVK